MLGFLYSWILLSWFGGGGISHIAQANELIKKAEYAYQHKDYAAAAKHYTMLVDSLNEGGERAVLNLAHSHYHIADTARASDYYHRLLGASNMAIRSVANQQLGLMAAQRQDLENALSYMKAALRADPTNNLARHNYIKIKKLKNQQQAQQPQPNKEQGKPQQKDNNQKQQDKEQQQEQNQQSQQGKNQQSNGKQGQRQQSEKQSGKDQKQNEGQASGEKGKDTKHTSGKEPDNKDSKADAKGAKGSPKNGQAEKDATAQSKSNPQKLANGSPQNGEGEDMAADPEQLKKMKITAEKAKMILESMRSSEVQYLQQRKHKIEGKRSNKDKPDW